MKDVAKLAKATVKRFFYKDITTSEEEYDAALSGMSERARYKIGNWLAHGMFVAKTQGMLMMREDYTEEGEVIFITRDGIEVRLQIIDRELQDAVKGELKNAGV